MTISLLQELDSIACRTKEFEVKLVYLRLLSVLLSRTKAGTKPSNEVKSYYILLFIVTVSIMLFCRWYFEHGIHCEFDY